MSKNLTIDAGVRFYKIGPTKSRGDDLAVFIPDQYDPAAAPALIQPVSTPQGRRGRNPITGEIVPAVKIGTFAQGSGDPTNGIQVFNEGVMDAPPIQVAPRVGFSWDVNGDGKTAVRGGFGVFPDRFNDDIVLQHVELPPLVNTPTANYTTISELLATPLSLSPAQVRTLNPDYKPQYTYNYSIGVQRDLGYKLVGDFSYVGSKGRKLLQTRNLNAVPYGTNFLPSSIDPTTGGALPNVFLRPYLGYARHPVLGVRRLLELRRAADGRSTAATRPGCASASSYTFAKTQNVGIASPPNNNPTVNPFLSVEDRNYGDAGRRHNLAVDYSYQVPNLSSKWDSVIAKIFFDDWEVSGVTTALSGARPADQLLDLGRQRSHRRGRRGRRQPRRPHLQSEPVARRPHLAAGVRHRVLRAAVAGQQPRRHGARRRDHRSRLPELGPVVHPQHPARRDQPAAVPHRAVQRLQQRPVLDRQHQPRCSTRRGSRPTASSGSTPRRGRRGGSCSRCAPCSRRGAPCSEQEKALRGPSCCHRLRAIDH